MTELDRLDSWEENRFVQVLQQNGKQLLVGLAGLFLLLLLIYKLLAYNNSNVVDEYLTAENSYTTMQNAPDSPAGKAAENQLKELVNKHAELQTKYDGPLAQLLINQEAVKEALPYANRALARTLYANEPSYSQYAATTLLIAEKNYSQALEQAASLQNQLRNYKEGFETLTLLNLLRIGSLQHTLNLKADELKTWQEWKQLTAKRQFNEIATQLQTGKVSLNQFIESRIKILKGL